MDPAPDPPIEACEPSGESRYNWQDLKHSTFFHNSRLIRRIEQKKLLKTLET